LRNTNDYYVTKINT